MTRQYPLPLPHREAMEADDFMVTPSNREAIAWIDQWPNWPSHGLIIYGPAGCGKTHLSHVWLSKSHGKSVTLQEILSQNAGTLIMNNRMIAVDNAEKGMGKRETEEALFHLYNLLQETKGFLLLTAKQPPAQWHIQLADLRSRLLSLPAVSLAAIDDDLLSALLIKQFRDRQIDITMDIIDYLLPRVERSPEAIRRLVSDLDRASLAEGRGITVALARRLLGAQSFPNA
jgi:DnaA regulatory inactivator Hda